MMITRNNNMMFIYPLINGTALSSYLQMSFRVSRDESCAKDLGNAPRVAGCGISIVRMCGAFFSCRSKPQNDFSLKPLTKVCDEKREKSFSPKD
jgi:hypothetical protein